MGTDASFHETMGGQERSVIRRAIRNASGINNNRKAVLDCLCNLWFANRAKGEIHPGAEKIAAKAGLSVRSVKTFLAEFRKAGFIVAVAYEKGGRRATRYVVSLWKILTTLCPSKVLTLAGKLVERQKEKPCKNCTRIKSNDRPFVRGWGDVRRFALGFAALGRRRADPYQEKQRFLASIRPERSLAAGGCPF